MPSIHVCTYQFHPHFPPFSSPIYVCMYLCMQYMYLLYVYLFPVLIAIRLGRRSLNGINGGDPRYIAPHIFSSPRIDTLALLRFAQQKSYVFDIIIPVL